MYKLWIANKNYSSWSLRPWVLLKVLQIPFEENLCFFENGKSSHNKFSRFSPTGLVPCLVDDKLTVWDSLAICEYIAETHPQVWPKDNKARAWARSASAEMHSGFTYLRQQCPMNVAFKATTATISSELQTDLNRLQQLWQDGLNQFGGPWLAGNEFSVVDAFFAPVAFRIRSYQLPISPAAQHWVARVLDLPAMKEWHEASLHEPNIDH
ncbi:MULTISPECIES: glutathione S-transferase family protein [Providencia]|uniref:glutathione S-transferase family protein n=1 Tax=Providencia TaxID=586 RepID=UPI0015EC3B6A|nr:MULTISPECIES: glutathione S-transferase family protein [Providencia]ELR5140466.1 glutathione S-transferase family protein [Providencia rettgeri]ELR5170637.1 glutathione S-transferase family protein [Providencia rettgeri]QLQ92607.1 glutathione S-transferase family protein [Providencia rettgeri]WEB83222.1 glutathione S-transferase family protein [Providencia rettgeri]HCH7938179.1 glutathione S-transferase family protein [Providencia rettgeri]